MSATNAFVAPTPLANAAARVSHHRLSAASPAPSLSARRPPTAHATGAPPPPRRAAENPNNDPHPGAPSRVSHTPSANGLPDSNLFRIDVDKLPTSPEENLRGFIKTRGSLIPGEEFVYWFRGEVYGVVDGSGRKHLFGIEGYNIGRMMRVDGGWRMLTREMAAYRAGGSNGSVLSDSWHNPYTGRDDKVVHVWNDPVNQELLLDGPRGRFLMGTSQLDGSVCWHADVFPRYASPLPGSQFPDVGGSDMYEATEIFQLFASERELADPNSPAVQSCNLSWVRIGPWLPWMRMGDRQGRLVYSCRGRKLASFADLPQDLREFVLAEHPEFCAAPFEFSRPNETSWTYMRKILVDGKGKPRADGRVAPDEPEQNNYFKASDGDKAPAAGQSAAATAATPEQLSLTRAQLAEFDGRDGAKVYVSVMGRVFDVSSARRHYGAGQTYHCLAGRDASVALISGDLSREGIEGKRTDVELAKLDVGQQASIDGWLKFYADHYPEVGQLSDL